MIPNPKDILVQFLDLIGYKGNKQQYSLDFLSLCHEEALENLSEEQRNAYKKSLTETITKNFQTLLNETYSLISEDRQKKVDDLLNSLISKDTPKEPAK